MKIWKRGMMASACLMMAVFLAGCSVTEALSAAKRGEREYGKAETMMILSTERLRYETVYSEEIWNASVDSDGMTFEAAMLGQVHDFLKEIKTLNLMAKEQKADLSAKDKELAKTAASEYMKALGESLAGEFGIEEKSAEEFYRDYRLAQQMAETIAGSMDLEVSDSEARVILVSQIEFSDRETAENVLRKIQEDGALFDAAAEEYSEDSEIRGPVFRGMRGAEYETAVFALEEGGISGVLSDSGKYYLVKCVDDYDEEATKLRKEEMIREKTGSVFYSQYQSFAREHPLTEDKDLWNSLTVTGNPKAEADFFAIYEAVWE